MDSILDEVAGPKGTKISKEIVQREEYSRNGWRFEDSQLMGYERYVLTTTGEELESLGTPYTPQSKSLEKITDECTAAGIPTRATCRVIQEYTRPDNTPYSHRLAPVKVALIPTHLTFIHEEDEETSYQQARFHCMYEGTSYPIIDAHTLRGVPFKHKIKDLGWDDDLVHHRSIHTERIFIDKAGALNLGGIPVQDLIVNKGKKTEQVHEHISKVWEALPGMNYKILHSKKEYR